MPKVTLRQGVYVGAVKDKTNVYHGIPYVRPFMNRFGQPQPLPEGKEEFSATELANNSPQLTSRLAFINGEWDPSTKYDEQASGVLSVYAPENAGSGKSLPVIVWIHGGAFVSGGSQLSNYNGSKLAQDAEAIVVCINYRVGALGFLYDENRSLDNGPEFPAGTTDVIAAFEWVHPNIHAFGGDSSNVTSMSQSAGAYNTQVLLAVRPDLLHKAVVISSPASLTNPPSSVAKLREDLKANLPDGTTPDTAPMDALLQAQTKATIANPDSLAPWGPTTTIVPGFKDLKHPVDSKQILIGWTADDGKVFSHLMSPDKPLTQLNNELTESVFRGPGIALAKQLRSQGHTVTAFELNWAPKDFVLGATHCVDLPLTFGFEAWPESPLCVEGERGEWEKRGKQWRQRLGSFVRDGTPFVTEDGVEVI